MNNILLHELLPFFTPGTKLGPPAALAGAADRAQFPPAYPELGPPAALAGAARAQFPPPDALPPPSLPIISRRNNSRIRPIASRISPIAKFQT